ncbi:MAG: sulfatase-like hydrolase/transferase [Ruminococcus sp.]|nr:sulfatase-like hydrolase/transferase [Ruminococcus sp.]
MTLSENDNEKKLDAAESSVEAPEKAEKTAEPVTETKDGAVEEKEPAKTVKENAAKAETKKPSVKTAAKAAAKPEKKPHGRFNKLNELTIVLLSIAVSFTIFFFSPIDIFIGNQREFVVGFKHVVLPLLFTAAACSAALIVFMNILLLIKEWLCQGFARLLFGFLLAIYTQSLLLNSKMTSLTGDDARYTDDTKMVFVNIFILSLIFFLPLALYIMAKLLPKNKVLNAGKGMVVPYVSGLIFAMQLVGFGSSVASADFSKYNRNYTRYLSYEPSMSLSTEGNVVVFLTDRLDSLWMDEVIDRYPDVREKFDGFTFYQNNVSHNTNTFPSVPQMLTNYRYKGTEWPDYTSKAWEGKTLPRVLTENGYNCNLLIDSLTTYSTISQLEDQCYNIKDCPKEDIDFNYRGKGGIIPTMTQLSLSRLSPYAFKSYFTVGLGANLSADFIQYKNDYPDIMPSAIGVQSDIDYYHYLKSTKLKADSDKKTFTFVHLNCSHGNSAEEVNLYDPHESVDIYSTTRGDFEILFEYFDQMKKLGVYDNTTVIVLGDHGRAPTEIEQDGKDGLTSAITTALLVKPAGEHGELKLDRDSELSNDFFSASVLDYAGIDHSEFGYSYRDVVDGGLHPDRFMQTFEWGGYGKVTYKAYYKITGDARDFNNWEEQDKHE